MSNPLFIVPTPIGNLGDMSFRAIEVLSEVDLILAEDTRTSGKLMKHFEIDTPLRSFHMHNEHKLVEGIVNDIAAGKKIAMISDAGTPGISDPGYLLVHHAIKEGIEVQCLPGATAFVPALVMSGFPSDRFVFEGFLPPKKGRQTRLLRILEETATVILYESPHRVKRLLKELAELGIEERAISLSREISKKFEETIRGNAKELLTHFEQTEPKGEYVVVIDGQKKRKKK
jgi:16S rRNA (cytidine1402-2'-O)-methyltransferase